MAKDKLIGKQFYMLHADSNIRMTVIQKQAPDIYLCASDEDCDYGYIEKLMSASQLKAIIEYDTQMKQLENKEDAWLVALPIGSIVHYHDGFGQYVRCEVITLPKNSKVFKGWENDGWHKAGKALKAIALVGNYRERDLPRILNHEVNIPYNAKRVLENDIFTCHVSNLYEYSSSKNDADPTNMTPIKIILPTLSAEDLRIGEIKKAAKEVYGLLSEPNEDNLQKAIEVLQSIAA